MPKKIHVINHDIGANVDADMSLFTNVVCWINQGRINQSTGAWKIEREVTALNHCKLFRHSCVPLIAGKITMWSNRITPAWYIGNLHWMFTWGIIKPVIMYTNRKYTPQTSTHMKYN